MYDPVGNIIPRVPDPKLKEIVDKLSLLIDQFVDFGSNVLQWDAEVKRIEQYNAPIMLSFRHFLELLDSTSILVKQSSIDPCKLQLRGMLETYLSLSYMLEKDTPKRSMAFLVWHIHQQIKTLQKGDAESQMGKEFRAKLKKDKYTKHLAVPSDPNAKERIAAREALLKDSVHQEAEAEYQRLRSTGEKDPAWYRFYGGPKSMVELADKLYYMALYDLLYRKWSGPVHGTDVIAGKTSIAPDGTTEIWQLRTYKDVQHVGQWALNLSLMMFEFYVDKRIPERKDDYRKWYLTIQEPYLRIASPEPLINVT